MLTREEIKTFDLRKVNKIHLIGISSPFNSFCATKLLSMNKIVTASEIGTDDVELKYWTDKGIAYPGGHNEKYITPEIDLVVYPNGPIPGNPECEKTEKLGIPAITVGQLTGILTKDLKVIAIAGTHGKSTTTALATWLLWQLDQEPNYVIGGKGDVILDVNKNWNVNPESKYFIVEACEYKRQFLDRAPSPFISVITHIDLDHTDYYKDQSDYNDAFVEFLGNTKDTVIIDKDGKNESQVVKTLLESEISAEIIDVNENSKIAHKISTNLIGEFNKQNILRAYTLGKALNFPHKQIAKAISSFPGIAGRLEWVGTVNGSPIYKDYAHNPQKVESCITAVKAEFPDKKLVFVFQPHSHERTYTFKKEFAVALSKADTVLLPNIYSPTRETVEQRNLISADDFARFVNSTLETDKILYTKTLEKTAAAIQKEAEITDCAIVLASAGDLYKIIPLLRLNKTSHD
ncbi:hypothetical protein JW962_00050 [Candidatus Dojkabacteria bacterium]|nr:hypothetical protein [Candidatus Dojkabacteria bacterium]